MRRSDREIKNLKEITEIMGKCDVCRVALNDEEYPYILPLNFGMKVEEEHVTLYFHGALEGRKMKLIEKNPKASFEMDCSHQFVGNREACKCTMEYESVIGYGIIEAVSQEEKRDALCIMMKHYLEDKEFWINEAVLSKTVVLKLDVISLTGKRLRRG